MRRIPSDHSPVQRTHPDTMIITGMEDTIRRAVKNAVWPLSSRTVGRGLPVWRDDEVWDEAAHEVKSARTTCNRFREWLGPAPPGVWIGKQDVQLMLRNASKNAVFQHSCSIRTLKHKIPNNQLSNSSQENYLTQWLSLKTTVLWYCMTPRYVCVRLGVE